MTHQREIHNNHISFLSNIIFIHKNNYVDKVLYITTIVNVSFLVYETYYQCNILFLYKTIINVVSFILYILSVLEFKISLAEYVLIENLINYQGGFVRRGLLGDIIFKLNYYSGVNHIKIIICIYLSAYFLFIILFYKNTQKGLFTTITFYPILKNRYTNYLFHLQAYFSEKYIFWQQ